MSGKLLFIEREGGLIDGSETPPSVDTLTIAPGVMAALQRLRGAGYELVAISDRRATPIDDFLGTLFESQGIVFRDWLCCRHDGAADCRCAFPNVDVVKAYVAPGAMDRDRAALIAVRDATLELALNVGIKGMLLERDGWEGVARTVLDAPRTARVRRKTRETEITVSVDLDRSAEPAIHTGIGFFDHMLEQLGKHGGFALSVDCRGDLEVDEHHTVEDVALAVGDALAKALGDKRGIGRYGFLLPMDESEARVALDLSGRAYFVFDGQFPRDRVGGLPTELVPHFFRSLSDALAATLHVDVSGENAHHMVEACFKAVARTLRQAIARSGDDLPSTKGQL